MKRLYSFFLCVFLLLGLCACGQKAEPAVEAPTWQEQYDLGIRYLSEGNYEEAIIAFTAAIEIDPKQPDAYLKAAEAYGAIGDPEGARAILEQGLQTTGDERFSELLVAEEAPVDEEAYEVAARNADGSIDHGILQVQVQDSRSAVVTIRGLTMRDVYMTNLPDSEEDAGEYNWMVEMYMTDGSAYCVSTAWWPLGDEVNMELPVTEMQHSIWVYDGDSWSRIDDVEMSYTADSITWNFTVPEEYPFDFAQVERYVVDVLDTARDEYFRTTYLVE